MGPRRGRLNAGFDLTFTAPKSVSLLLAIGDDRVREAVLDAQAAGVAAALSCREAHELQVRRGAGGQRSPPSHPRRDRQEGRDQNSELELSRQTLALTRKLSPSAPAATSGPGLAGPPKGAEPSR